MRSLIDPLVLKLYKIAFLPVPEVNNYDATLINFDSLPDVEIITNPIREDYIRPILFKEDEASCVLLMDKPNVHALYSLMITQAGRKVRKSFADLTVFERAKVFQLGARFFEYWQKSDELYRNYLPRFSFNHDPFTIDRSGLQSIDRFHAHIYLNDERELETSLKNLKSLREIVFNPDYKDYYDPSALLLEMMLVDAHSQCLKVPQGFKIIDLPIHDKIALGWGLGFNLVYKGKVDFFTSQSFIDYIMQVHRFLEMLFDLPAPLEKHIYQHDYLRESTRHYLEQVLSKLRPLSEKTYHYLKSRAHHSKNILSYRKLSYSFAIDYNRELESFVVSIVPRLFSEIGGAGFFSYKDANYVVVKRGVGKFSSFENNKRREFQMDFMNYCRD